MMYASVNDFLRDYGMYLAIGVAALIVVAAAAILLLSANRSAWLAIR